MTLSLGAMAALNIVLSFVCQCFILATLGAGTETDALFASTAVPQFLLTLVTGSFVYVLVPMLSVQEEVSRRQHVAGLLRGTTLGFGFLTLALLATAGLWTPWMVPGFGPAETSLTVALTRIHLLWLLLVPLTAVLQSDYQAREKFLWAQAASLVAGAASLLFTIWALPRAGVAAAAWGQVLRAAVELTLLLPAAWGFWRLSARTTLMAEFWRRVKPLILGASYYKTDVLVDRLLSSMSPAGGLSLLYLGQQIYGAVGQILNRAIAAPMVPGLARAAELAEWAQFRRTYRARLRWMLLLSVLGLAGLWLVGEPILGLVFARGRLTSGDVHRLWLVMLALVGFFAGGACGQITSVAFYSRGQTRTPIVIGVWTYTVFIPLKVLAFFQFGLMGLAACTSVLFLLNAAAQYHALERDPS
ncbi:MAG: virulence factor MviN [Candidatus Riflebacteria bacterium]|nr:virulence factor MviN [Candidatus Riflebacteria bacterium]